MRALQAWGEDRFKPMVMLAHLVAASVEECYELIGLARRQSMLALDKDCKVESEDWLRLYRRPWFVEAAVARFASTPEASPDAGMAADYRKERREAKHLFGKCVRSALLKGISERRRRATNRWLNCIYIRAHLPMIEQMLVGDDKAPPANFREWLAAPEFLFFMGVVAPCMLEYQTTPWKLYRAAKQGSYGALERLVRLDPHVLAEPQIVKIVFRMQAQNSAGLEQLRSAQSEGRTEAVSLEAVKYLLGGLLMRWSNDIQETLDGELFFGLVEDMAPSQRRAEVMKWIKSMRAGKARNRVRCRLTAPAIKDLFDAVFQDSGRGRFDPDFQKDPKTIYRRLRRNADQWPELRKGNMKRAA